MNAEEIILGINNKKYDKALSEIYPDIKDEKKRYISLLKKAKQLFNNDELRIYSTGGRIEVGGNHTDHQLGHVLASSISLDIVAVVRNNNSHLINLYEKGYKFNKIDIRDLKKKDAEIGKTESLIRGICKAFKNNGYQIGGFDLLIDSKIPQGSGLSSSAAFEIMIGTILNDLFNENCIDYIEMAKFGQYAENKYFGKPCGLMDQLACAYGGCIAIDFANLANIKINSVPLKLNDYEFIITQCGNSHDDLTDEYGAITSEMKAVAKHFKKNYLSELTLSQIIDDADVIRKKYGDRAFLRSIHFFQEDKRAQEEYKAIKNNDIDKFLELVKESGHSSFEYLQNIYVSNDYKSQNLAVGLALSQLALNSKGAYRVHGGGFGGTILAIVPKKESKKYINIIEKVFGHGSCLIINQRNKPSSRII